MSYFITVLQNALSVPNEKGLHALTLCLLQAGESVLSALSGCKMLRELSKLEMENETKLSMKELAQKFENLAHGETANTGHLLIFTLYSVCVLFADFFKTELIR